MRPIFPPMYDQPEKNMHFASLAYWIFAFGVIPSFMPLIATGLWDNLQFSSWMDLIYHAINAIAIVMMYGSYFVESFFNVRLAPGAFLKTVGVALALMLGLVMVLHFDVGIYVFDAYPINEMSVAVTSGVMTGQLPVFGTLCHTVCTPVAVVGLFYTVGFAPVCCRKSWLGYLTVALLMLVPCIFDILWRGAAELVISIYLLQLPIHLIACWSYQKADTVWAPMVTLAVFNLITSLLGMFLV